MLKCNVSKCPKIIKYLASSVPNFISFCPCDPPGIWYILKILMEAIHTSSALIIIIIILVKSGEQIKYKVILEKILNKQKI